MPKENIERLLKRFEERKNNLSSGLLEAFGPFGVPMMIEFETDNKNRILGEVKLILRNFSGNLGESGSVAFMFERVGEIETEKDLDEATELFLIDAGVVDVDSRRILTKSEDLNRIKSAMIEKGIGIENAALIYQSLNPIKLNTEEELDKILDLIEELEENEDIVNVFAGFDYEQKT